jgi:hypothetical protein
MAGPPSLANERGDIAVDRRHDLLRDTLEANGLETSARGIDEGAERRRIDRLTGKPPRAQILKHGSGERGMPNKLPLRLREPVVAAEVALNASNQIDTSPIRNRSAVYVLKR